MKTSAVVAALAATTAAWPTAMQQNEKLRIARQSGRGNTGAGHPIVAFDAAEQYVDVTAGGPNPFRSPNLRSDLRGQCPGLNAAANHGFLPRNGRATITQTVTGLAAAYGMSPDLSAFLAVVSILLSGDIPSGQWSIGGGFRSTLPLLLSDPKGIEGTHNKYEGDASIIRGDAYLNGGNVGVFQWRSWNNLMELGGDEDTYTLDKIASQSNFVTQYSINNNPYYFSGPFSGLVAPAAHDFVINFMSNHSAENPTGFLNRAMIKDFFAVSGTGAGASGENPGDYVHNRGQERIPENWYRRPTSAAYNIPDVFLDLLANAAIHPDVLRIGGNTGTTNSFAGVEVSDLTGGAFNGASLAEGNNLACFAYQAAQAGTFDQLDGVLGIVGDAVNGLTGQLSNAFAGLSCPQLRAAGFNNQFFDQFPGARQ